MKSILNKILLNTISIAVVSCIAPGLTYNHNVKTLLIAALALAIINAFLKPLLKILLLPINIITLGLTGWLVNVLILFLVTIIVPNFEIIGFSLQLGQSTIVFSVFWAYIFISFLLNLVTTFISWIIK